MVDSWRGKKEKLFTLFCSNRTKLQMERNRMMICNVVVFLSDTEVCLRHLTVCVSDIFQGKIFPLNNQPFTMSFDSIQSTRHKYRIQSAFDELLKWSSILFIMETFYMWQKLNESENKINPKYICISLCAFVFLVPLNVKRRRLSDLFLVVVVKCFI